MLFCFFTWHKLQCFGSPFFVLHLLFSVLRNFSLFCPPSPSHFPLSAYIGSSQQLTVGHTWEKIKRERKKRKCVSFLCLPYSLKVHILSTAWWSKALLEAVFGKQHALQLLCSARHSAKHLLGLERGYTFFSFFHWILWVSRAFMKGWTWWGISTSMSVSIIL